MKIKRVKSHAFYIFNKDNHTLIADFETSGNYENAKKETLEYLSSLNQDKIIGILWTYSQYQWNGKYYEHCGIISNLISNCAHDNRLTVAEAIKSIKEKSKTLDWTYYKDSPFE